MYQDSNQIFRHENRVFLQTWKSGISSLWLLAELRTGKAEMIGYKNIFSCFHHRKSSLCRREETLSLRLSADSSTTQNHRHCCTSYPALAGSNPRLRAYLALSLGAKRTRPRGVLRITRKAGLGWARWRTRSFLYGQRKNLGKQME